MFDSDRVDWYYTKINDTGIEPYTWPVKDQDKNDELYITTKLLLFETFVAWEQFFYVCKQAAFDWLKIFFKSYPSL